MGDARLVTSPEVVLREEGGGGALLFVPATGARLAVNAVGAVVWRLLDGTRDLSTLVAALGDTFTRPPPAAAAEIAAFVADLQARGLVGPGPVRPPLPPAPPAPPEGVAPTPAAVQVDITSRCNLRCRYCYYFDNPAVTYEDLPTADWEAFFAELGRAAVLEVCFAGGEPLLRPDLPALVAAVAGNGMRFSVLSNGALVDDAMAALLADTGRCDFVQVSVDGSRPETHDSLRGRGSFAAALAGIHTLQRHGVPVTSRLTVHPGNLADLDAAAHLLLEELGLPGFTTNAAGALGSCRARTDEARLGVDQYQEAMAALARLAARYPGRITAAAGPLDAAGRWRAMDAARAAGAPPWPDGGRLTGCGCPFAELTVRSDGLMVPCTMLAHLPLGRIGEDPLVEVWQRSPILARLRARRDLPLCDLAECAACAYAPYCTGGCPATAHGLVGELDRPSPDACLRRFLAAGGALPG